MGVEANAADAVLEVQDEGCVNAGPKFPIIAGPKFPSLKVIHPFRSVS